MLHEKLDLETVKKMTPAEYAELDGEAKATVHRLAAQANRELIGQAFTNPEVAWALVAGAPGEAILFGVRRERLTDDQIQNMEIELGRICFYYSRPDTVEEATAADASRLAHSSISRDIMRRMRQNVKDAAHNERQAALLSKSLRGYGPFGDD